MNKISEMTEQELVNLATGSYLQNACNVSAIANTFCEVTRRLRDLNLNGNDHIAQKWIIDKLSSLVGRDILPANEHEDTLVENAFRSELKPYESK